MGMGRTKHRKSVTPTQREGLRIAHPLGLYLLFEAKGVWRVYAKASGKVIGFWDSQTGRYHFGPERGRSDDAAVVLAVAAVRIAR